MCILFLNEVSFSHIFPFHVMAPGAEKELGGSVSRISASFSSNRHHTQEDTKRKAGIADETTGA